MSERDLKGIIVEKKFIYSCTYKFKMVSLTPDRNMYVECVSMGGRVSNESHRYALKKFSFDAIVCSLNVNV